MPKAKKYWNTEQSFTATCPEGQIGSNVGYVAARWTWSSKSVAEANQIALAEATRKAKEGLQCRPVVVEPPIEPPVEPPPTTKWYFWCYENETVTVPPNTRVRYGAADKWSEKVMSGQVTANNETFGDPIYGTGKWLEAVVAPVTVPPIEPPIEPPPVTEPPSTVQTILVDATTTIKVDGSDNATVLKNIANMYRNRSELIVISVPAGEITTTSNTWFRGLLKWKVVCNTGEFAWKHIGGNDWYVSHSPFLTDGLFFNVESELGQAKLQPMAKFKTAKQGDMSITLIDMALISEFKKGSYQFLEGYDCQGQGWPINPRFFEWKWIADVNTSTGVITFTEPLEKSYNQEWKDWWYYDGNGYFGKPRIHVIDPLYAKYVEIVNGRIIPQLGWNNEPANVSAIFVPGDELLLKNMDVNGSAIWPTANRKVTYDNCRGGGWEIDKCIGLMTVINSKMGGLWAGTGLRQLVVKDTEFTSFSPMTPQRAYFENVRVNTGNVMETASIYTFGSWTGGDKWEFKNCVFSKVCPPIAVETKQVTAANVANNTFTIPDDPFWDADVHKFSKLCFHGSSIWNNDNSVRVRMDDVIYRDGHYVVQYTPEKGTLTNNMVLNYKLVREVVDLGGNKLSDGTPIIIKA